MSESTGQPSFYESIGDSVMESESVGSSSLPEFVHGQSCGPLFLLVPLIFDLAAFSQRLGDSPWIRIVNKSSS